MPRFSSSVTAARRLAATDALEPHGINNSAPRWQHFAHRLTRITADPGNIEHNVANAAQPC